MTEPACETGRTRWLYLAVIGLGVMLMAGSIPRRGIDPDELEHLHAGFCVWRGDVPYRDFFEHHGPGLYYLIWPVFKGLGPELTVLWVSRGVMLCLSLAALYLTYRLSCHVGGERCGLPTVAGLVWMTIFQAKGMELRPDVPAMLCLLSALTWLCQAGDRRTPRAYLSVGFLCGLALLFTQKSLIPMAGIGLAACAGAGDGRTVTPTVRVRKAISIAALLGAGAACAWGLATAGFACAGAAGDFWYSTWYQLWIWPVHSSRWDYLRPTLAADLTIWALALSECGGVISNWLTRGFRSRLTPGADGPTSDRTLHVVSHQQVVIAVGVCLASIPFVKATYPQFYFLWLPLLAILAGSRYEALLSKLNLRNRVVPMVALALGLAVLQTALWTRTRALGADGALPHFIQIPGVAWAVLLVIGVTFGAVVMLAWNHRGEYALFAICGLGMAYGVLRDFDMALWSNRSQVAAIQAIQQQVSPQERVFDGFTGLAALRPHAWYYWWINEYSLALIPPKTREQSLLEHLQQNPPAALLFDRHLESLPGPVVDWLHEHYAPVDPIPLWKLKANR